MSRLVRGLNEASKADEDVVTIFPPEKSPEAEAVLLKCRTRNGEVLRFRVSAAIVRMLGTKLPLLSTTSGDR